MSFRCSDDENLQSKFTRLLETAGLANIDLAGKFVAIKMHFAPIMPGCCLEGQAAHGDIFTAMHPQTCWHDAIAEAERMSLGSSRYARVEI